MNILHIIPYYAPAWSYGGVVRAATDMTRAQVEAGHTVTVLTSDTYNATGRLIKLRETIDGVEVWRVRNLSNDLRARFNLAQPWRLPSVVKLVIKERAIELVHCHEVRTVENLQALPVVKRQRLPVVVSPHGTLPLDTGRGTVKRLWDRAFGKQMLPRFDQVIALTENEANDARAVWESCGVALPDDRISVVPNGVQVDDFTDLPSGDDFRAVWNLGDGPIVLFLGRLHERKGLHLLIPAFAEVVTLAPDVRLLLVGPDEGMLARLKMLVDKHKLGECVIFTGMLEGNDKRAALAAADLFVMPAVGEGFSMAVLEAMACGLPVLLTPGCNFPEVVNTGAGLVVERTIPALSAALTDLLTDADRRTRMGEAAREMIHARYTWPQVIRQMDEVYQMVMKRR